MIGIFLVSALKIFGGSGDIQAYVGLIGVILFETVDLVTAIRKKHKKDA